VGGTGRWEGALAGLKRANHLNAVAAQRAAGMVDATEVTDANARQTLEDLQVSRYVLPISPPSPLYRAGGRCRVSACGELRAVRWVATQGGGGGEGVEPP